MTKRKNNNLNNHLILDIGYGQNTSSNLLLVTANLKCILSLKCKLDYHLLAVRRNDMSSIIWPKSNFNFSVYNDLSLTF
jgi:hypothetical protein